MESMSYRVEITKKVVRAMGPDGYADGLDEVVIIWDDAEGIGLEVSRVGGISGDIVAPRRVNSRSPFSTEQGRKHAREVAERLKIFAKRLFLE